MTTGGLLFLFAFAILNGPIFAFLESNSSHFRFDLAHPGSQVLSGDHGNPKSIPERYGEMVQNDAARHRLLFLQRHRQQNLTSSSSRRVLSDMEMRIRSGADFLAGQYLAHFKVGRPFQKMLLAMDTGSDLTWVKCRFRCGKTCDRRMYKKAYNPKKSKTFRTVPCGSRTCKDLRDMGALDICPTPSTPCMYHYSYLDGSYTKGSFVYEEVTAHIANGKKKKKRMIIGCSNKIHGFKEYDGVLGLSYSRYSLPRVAFQKFKGTFSYCLVDSLSHKNISSHLTFGPVRNKQMKMQYTPLRIRRTSTGYFLRVAGISVGGEVLRIPPSVWNLKKGGGTIIDSGTSITLLASTAYRHVLEAFGHFLKKFPAIIDYDTGPFHVCFKAVNYDEHSVPKLVFLFSNGAKFEPPVRNYILDYDEDLNIKCLGFLPAGDYSVSIIGNIMQQNHYWEYDLNHQRLGFAASRCS